MFSDQPAARALVPHLSGAFLTVGARAGAAGSAQERGGEVQGEVAKCQCWCCYCESGLELGFSLLARGSRPPNLNTEEGGESSQSRLFFDLDFWPPVAYGQNAIQMDNSLYIFLKFFHCHP